MSAGGLGLARSNLFQRVYACLACGAVLLPGAAAAAHRADDLAFDHNREAAFGGDYAVEGESREAGSASGRRLIRNTPLSGFSRLVCQCFFLRFCARSKTAFRAAGPFGFRIRLGALFVPRARRALRAIALVSQRRRSAQWFMILRL